MSNIYELRPGEILNIGGADYTTKGAMEFQQESYFWKEYALLDSQGNTHWLSVEKGNSENRYMLTVALAETFPPDDTLIYNDVVYDILESGNAKVVRSWGDVDVSVGDKVGFKEYLSTDGSNQLLAWEQWDDEIEYSNGRYVLESNIIGKDLDFALPALHERDEGLQKKLLNMPMGQYVTINGNSYYMATKIKNKQGSFHWWEYEMIAEKTATSRFWLSVEKDGDKLNMELSKPISRSALDLSGHPKSVTYNKDIFRLTESGSANVASFSSGDYDPNEQFYFEEYHNDKGQVISMEYWTDEKEASFGNILNPDNVVVEDRSKISAKVTQGFISKIFFAVMSVFIIFVVFGSSISQFFLPTIANQLKSNKDYQYITSITLNENSKQKADVYQYRPSSISSLIGSEYAKISIPLVSEMIISLDPERVTRVDTIGDDVEDSEVLIVTSREQVLIYRGEEDEVYVQVSRIDKQPEYSSAPYRARHRTRAHHFYRSGLSNSNNFSDSTTGTAYNINSGVYTSYTQSARQSSINARQSSGGGTSYGK